MQLRTSLEPRTLSVGKREKMADIYVEMTKDGRNIIVHPATVANHKQLGWAVVKEGVSLKGEKAKEPPKDETKKPG
jgi:hypothetical protein